MEKNSALIARKAFPPIVFPEESTITGQKVAFLVAQGIDGAAMLELGNMLEDAGAMVIYIAPFQGSITTVDGAVLQAWLTLENASNMLFDALVLPDGGVGIKALSAHKLTRVFLANQYRNGKAILAIGASRHLLDSAALSPLYSCSNEPDAVLLTESKNIISSGILFIGIMARHQCRY